MRAFVPVAVGQVDCGLSVQGLEVHIGFACGHRTDLTGGFAATRFVHDAAHTMRPGFIELL